MNLIWAYDTAAPFGPNNIDETLNNTERPSPENHTAGENKINPENALPGRDNPRYNTAQTHKPLKRNARNIETEAKPPKNPRNRGRTQINQTDITHGHPLHGPGDIEMAVLISPEVRKAQGEKPTHWQRVESIDSRYPGDHPAGNIGAAKSTSKTRKQGTGQIHQPSIYNNTTHERGERK